MAERLYPAECPNCNAPILDSGKCSQCEFAFATEAVPVKKQFGWARLLRFLTGVMGFSLMFYMFIGAHPDFKFTLRAAVAYAGVVMIIFGLSAIPIDSSRGRWSVDFTDVFGVREGEGLGILDLVAMLVGVLLIAGAFREWSFH